MVQTRSKFVAIKKDTGYEELEYVLSYFVVPQFSKAITKKKKVRNDKNGIRNIKFNSIKFEFVLVLPLLEAFFFLVFSIPIQFPTEINTSVVWESGAGLVGFASAFFSQIPMPKPN